MDQSVTVLQIVWNTYFDIQFKALMLLFRTLRENREIKKWDYWHLAMTD